MAYRTMRLDKAHGPQCMQVDICKVTTSSSVLCTTGDPQVLGVDVFHESQTSSQSGSEAAARRPTHHPRQLPYEE
jgi:hypothetical protein